MELSTEHDSYVLEVNEAAELLNVSRTRLSQLTSRGVLTFQRRKIGTRNRLFYRRSELMGYMRQRIGASAFEDDVPQPRFAAIAAAPHETFSELMNETPAAAVVRAKPMKLAMPTALSLQTQNEHSQTFSELLARLANLERHLVSQDVLIDDLSEQLLEHKRLLRYSKLTKDALPTAVSLVAKSPSTEQNISKRKKIRTLGKNRNVGFSINR